MLEIEEKTVQADGFEGLRKSLPFLLIFFLTLLSVRMYGHYLFDDSYFGFSYAKNLAEGHGFVFNPGQRYLGTSAPFVVPLYAFFYKFFGVDIVVTAQVLSFLLLIGGALSLFFLFRKNGEIPAFLAGLAFATTPLVTLVISHESLLYLGFGLLSVWALSRKKHLLAGVLVGIAMLCRMEAVVLFFPSLVLLLFQKEKKGLLLYGLSAFLILLPWLVFATRYFGSPLSNTVQAKQLQVMYGNAPFWKGALLWLNAVYPGVPEKIGLVALVLTSIAAIKRLDSWAALLVSWAFLQCLIYLALNVAYYHWFLCQLSILLAVGIQASFRLAREKKGFGKITMLSILFLAMASLFTAQFKAIFSNRVRIEDHAYYRLAHWVKENTKPTDRVAYLEIGMLKFYSGRFIVDWLGLTTPGVLPYLKKRRLDLVIEQAKPEIFIQNDLFNNYLSIEGTPWFRVNYHLKARVEGIGYPVPLKVYEFNRPGVSGRPGLPGPG